MNDTHDRFFAIGLSRETAARFVGVSPNTFDKMVDEGVMPKARVYGRRKLWNRLDIQSAFDALPADGNASDVNPWDNVA